MYIFYKMSCFPLSVHILQKLYPFLMFPLLCEEKSHSPLKEKLPRADFLPFSYTRGGLWTLPLKRVLEQF